MLTGDTIQKDCEVKMEGKTSEPKSCNNCDWNKKGTNYCRVLVRNISSLGYKCAMYISRKEGVRTEFYDYTKNR
ncbi:MAG: hypothetical protein CVV02_15240 [Firmicutes bacterium HGW-Firmicutes-7]|nr:MAG: hypothetical protein CVV02_15240 [Firmicutes bacterium HGW-Firmicutes-7]